jgi:hypothetical protein
LPELLLFDEYPPQPRIARQARTVKIVFIENS